MLYSGTNGNKGAFSLGKVSSLEEKLHGTVQTHKAKLRESL